MIADRKKVQRKNVIEREGEKVCIIFNEFM